MRISTNTLYQSGISKITNLQAEQSKLQGQISTGKRIVNPSDDPVAAARALEISYNKAINQNYSNTRITAKTHLETLESSLTEITNLLVSVQPNLVAAGNGAYSDLERGFLATELRGSLDALIGYANTKDAYGNFLYAGFRSDTAPFIANATGASYVGDSNTQSLQVDTRRQMEVSVSGDSVFQAGGNDVFSALTDIINLLNTPVTNAATQATLNTGISTAITRVQGAVDNVLNVRASIGAKLNEIDSLDAAGNDRDLQYTKALSDLRDLDYATALSEFAKNQTIMEAAQKSFSSTTQLSLFDFI